MVLIYILLAFMLYGLVMITIRLWPFLKGVYQISRMQKKAEKAYSDQQARTERTSRNNNGFDSRTEGTNSDPNFSSVDLIHKANLDLNGGEYVDYEPVREGNEKR